MKPRLLKHIWTRTSPPSAVALRGQRPPPPPRPALTQLLLKTSKVRLLPRDLENPTGETWTGVKTSSGRSPSQSPASTNHVPAFPFGPKSSSPAPELIKQIKQLSVIRQQHDKSMK